MSDLQWQSIKKYSEQMQQQLQAGDWQAMIDMQQKRQAMIEDFFSRDIPEDERHQQAEEILQLLEINRAMTAALQQQQKQISLDFQKHMTGKSGTQTYQQISDHR